MSLETRISGHNKDIIMKATAEMFKDRTLEMLGLKTARIVDVMPTVLPVVEAAEKRVDFVFLLEDETLLHLEFQTTVPEELLRRVAFYGARIVEVLRMTQIEQWLREEGREEGRLEGKLEDARNALRKGFSPEDIAEITGLPLDTILKLKAELLS